MRPAILSGAMAIPLEHVHQPRLAKALTAKHRPMGAEAATIVFGYEYDDEYMYVPRQFGLDYCRRNNIPFTDQTSAGTAVEFPRVATPRAYQTALIAAIVEAFGSYYDFIFKAHTGWGKTIGALIAAAQLGTTTLIIVDQDNLKDQWLNALDEHFGMTIANGHVGIIQGKKSDYEGKSVCIAMVQTLSQRTYEEELYAYFGFVIFDEVHTVGAPTFSVVLRQFPAQYRLGVSATPKRTDGLQKLLEYSLGRVRVNAEKEHDESAVYIQEHATVYSWYANTSSKVGRIITEVSEDGSRNLLLAEMIISLYETGRDTLVLSDRIEQLKHLQSLCYYMGVDESEMGLYTGMTSEMGYKKNPTPSRRPNYLVKNEETGEAEYTPISLQTFARKIPAKKLAIIKEASGILFGTYGKCAKGFDEPRLKAGVDATPRSESEQIHGRVLREVPGAKMPIWATIKDTQSYRLLFSFSKRIASYLKSNGRMYRWLPDGELEICHANEVMEEARAESSFLKECRIETNQDGQLMLLTPNIVKAQKQQALRDTVNRVRSRRPG